MGQLIQDMMIIVFGLVLILLLLFILRGVHKQAQRMKDLESELTITDKAAEATLETEKQEEK